LLGLQGVNKKLVKLVNDGLKRYKSIDFHSDEEFKKLEMYDF